MKREKSVSESRPTILIVDDRPENLFAMKKVLKPLDINILEATSGNESLKIALDNDLALVLLDVQMPEMDGFEVATLMHNNEKTRHIPIIFVTAMNKEEKYIIKGHQVGAVDYLFKPIDPLVLKSKVSVFIEHYSQKKELKSLLGELKETQTELEKSNEKFKNLAHRDPLTGIGNRLQFEGSLKRTIAHAERHHRRFALLYLDLDNFKLINDSLGHPAGDILLKEVSRRLEVCIRMDDTLSRIVKDKGGSVARLGGDEVAILLNEINSPSDAILVAKRILMSFDKPFDLNGNEVSVTTSIGVACYPDSAETSTALNKRADVALYHAKKSGKNTYYYIDAAEAIED